MNNLFFAGFYCSPEEKAAYADDKIIIRAVFISVFIGFSYIIATKLKRPWLKVTLIVLLAALCLIGTAITEITIIGLGC